MNIDNYVDHDENESTEVEKDSNNVQDIFFRMGYDDEAIIAISSANAFYTILKKLFNFNSEYYLNFWNILKKVLHPDYENELGNKYFLRQWSKL